MAKWSSKDRALYLLAQRDHSRQELVTKLKRHHSDDSDIQEALAYLDSLNLINESAFCSHYIGYRAARGIGPVKIKHELKLKGVADITISTAFTEAQINWQAILYSLFTKKFQGEFSRDLNHKSKQMRFFLSRGFTSEMVEKMWRATSNILNETE